MFSTLPGWSALSGWERAEVLSAISVAIGCFGEMWWLFRKGPSKDSFTFRAAFEEKKEKREKLFAILIAAGVMAEVVTLLHSLKESGEFRVEFGHLQQTNAWIWQTNFGLQERTSSNELAVAKANQLVSSNVVEAAKLARDTAFVTLPWSLPEVFGNPQLQAFSNTVAFFKVWPEPESVRVANILLSNLKRAGWVIMAAPTNSMRPPMNEGISILICAAQIPPGPRPSPYPNVPIISGAQVVRAGHTLIDWINNNSIIPVASDFPPASWDQPVGTILILIGSKPNPFTKRVSDEEYQRWLRDLTNDLARPIQRR